MVYKGSQRARNCFPFITHTNLLVPQVVQRLLRSGHLQADSIKSDAKLCEPLPQTFHCHVGGCFHAGIMARRAEGVNRAGQPPTVTRMRRPLGPTKPSEY